MRGKHYLVAELVNLAMQTRAIYPEQSNIERAKRALDLAEQSEAPNPGDQKGAEPPFLAVPRRPEGGGNS